ncbi:MAG: hypothetical protein RL386_302, partial [Bacteroidota bacterium]
MNTYNFRPPQAKKLVVFILWKTPIRSMSAALLIYLSGYLGI